MITSTTTCTAPVLPVFVLVLLLLLYAAPVPVLFVVAAPVTALPETTLLPPAARKLASVAAAYAVAGETVLPNAPELLEVPPADAVLPAGTVLPVVLPGVTTLLPGTTVVTAPGPIGMLVLRGLIGALSTPAFAVPTELLLLAVLSVMPTPLPV